MKILKTLLMGVILMTTKALAGTGYDIIFQDYTSGTPTAPQIIYEAADKDDLYREFKDRYEEDLAQYCGEFTIGGMCPYVFGYFAGYRVKTAEFDYFYWPREPSEAK